MRGWGGGRGLPCKIVGTGHKLMRVQEMVDDDWGMDKIMEEVGEDFVQHMTSTKWVKLSFPLCGGLV
jgi:hypothetical protein